MQKKLNVVFMGTPDFAVESLKTLVENGIRVVAVVTAPDKPAGRGNKLKASAVKRYAQQVSLPVLQPTNLKSEAFHQELQAYQPGLNAVVAFRMLPEAVWSMPPRGTVNLHASLLPDYRGAAPINHAIINGEKETGVTTFFIEKTIDTGAIIDRKKLAIGQNETAGELHDRLMKTGATLLLDTVHKIEAGKINPQNQQDLIDPGRPLKSAPKIHKADRHINWYGNAGDVKNFIHGLSPFPAAITRLVHKQTGEHYTLKLFRVANTGRTSIYPPGKIHSDGKSYIYITCGDHQLLSVEELQLEGRKALNTKEFLLGTRITNFEIADI